MKKCGKECFPICDYCRFYNFNPGQGGCYMGKGYCVLNEKNMDPSDGCKKFICFSYKMLSEHERSKKIRFVDKKYEKQCIKKQRRNNG